MPRAHLTDLGVSKLTVPATYWDETLPAFGVRVGKSTKTWIVVPDQRRVTKIIGYYPALPLAKARASAEIGGEIADCKAGESGGVICDGDTQVFGKRDGW
jgi:hypothetical protein